MRPYELGNITKIDHEGQIIKMDREETVVAVLGQSLLEAQLVRVLVMLSPRIAGVMNQEISCLLLVSNIFDPLL